MCMSPPPDSTQISRPSGVHAQWPPRPSSVGEAASRSAALADPQLAVRGAAQRSTRASVRRDARRKDDRRLVDDRADGELESRAVADAADDRHRSRRPGSSPRRRRRCKLARCAAGERRDGEGPVRLPAVHRRVAPARSRVDPVSDSGEQIGRRQVDRSGLRAAQTRRVQPKRLAIPRGAVDDALPVGREARLADVALTERQPAHHAHGRGRRGSAARDDSCQPATAAPPTTRAATPPRQRRAVRPAWRAPGGGSGDSASTISSRASRDVTQADGHVLLEAAPAAVSGSARACLRAGAVQSGSDSSTLTRQSVAVSPANAARRAISSYRTQPNDQMSVRRSSGLPRACSGLMYAAVPEDHAGARRRVRDVVRALRAGRRRWPSRDRSRAP